MSYPPQSTPVLFQQSAEKADTVVSSERGPVDVTYYQQEQRPTQSGFFTNALIDSEDDDKEYEYTDHPIYTERVGDKRGSEV